MFGKREIAKPKDVSVLLVNGEVCFQTYLALAWKPDDKFDQKDLDEVGRQKFSIEQFEEGQPEKKGMYEVVKSDAGKAYYLRFFPFKANKEGSQDLEFILRIMKRQ